MSYQVIARKWRPQTFEEVTGQEAITRTLRNALEFDRLHHAYLFSGARGVGKTTTARLLAKALNCQKFDKPTVSPCSFNDPTACASCREIAEGRSLDVLEFDAASNTQVDKIRELILESININPARDRYKIFIIDEVHMLSNSSFNALLKTLEEPPPRVVFIMATTELHKLPDTILSRIQQFEFRTIAVNKIYERLKIIADAENIKISEKALREIARAGEGSMRDAQSAFDQVISFSGETIEPADVALALGLSGAEMLSRIMNAIAAGASKEALLVVDELIGRGQDLRNFCRDLLTHIRDLLVFKASDGAEHLLDTASMSREELQTQAAKFSESDLIRFFHSLTDTEDKIKTANQPRYQLEIGLVKLTEMKRVAPFEKILERLAKLENALANGNFSGSTANSPEKKTSELTPIAEPLAKLPSAPPETANFPQKSPLLPPEKVQTAVLTANSATGLFTAPIPNFAPNLPISKVAPVAPPNLPPNFKSSFAEEPPGFDERPFDAPFENNAAFVAENQAESFSEKLAKGLEKRGLPFLASGLESSQRVALENDELKIEFTKETGHWQSTFEKPENAKILQSVGREIVGRDLKINIHVFGQTTTQLSPEAQTKKREKERLFKLAEQDAGVQAFLKVFRGEIVDVIEAEEPPEIKPD